MERHSTQPDDANVANNLRRAIELTELGLALRRSVLQQDEPDYGNSHARARRAKEQYGNRILLTDTLSCSS